MKRQNFSSFLGIGFFVLFIAAVVGYIIWSMFRPLAGTKVSVQGREHIASETEVNYNSSPPTSGAHSADTEEWGIYDKSLEMRKLVHNLEHGGIIIFYNCEKIVSPRSCEQIKQELAQVAVGLMRQDRKIIVVPETSIDTPVALASWGWHDKMELVDEKRIRKFFSDHINKAPERVF